VWRRSRVRRRWRLVERHITRTLDERAVANGIKALQLWR
jgi:hypothetical protein